MATENPWSPSQCPIASVNGHPCYAETDLNRQLRKALSGRSASVTVDIYDPAAQRGFLSLAVYSPEELLPQAVGSLVGKMHRGAVTRGTSHRSENLEMSLAITSLMNHSQSSTAMVVGAAVLSAINKGYHNVSFSTSQAVSHPEVTSGAVVIRMRT